MSAFTLTHVVISLVGIGSGLLVVAGLLAAKRLDTMTALYFNVFVLIVQAFLKVPALNAAAPTQSEPPFLVAQLINLVLFAALGVIATIRFRDEPSSRRARVMV